MLAERREAVAERGGRRYGGRLPSADRAAADRLIARPAQGLGRVGDPRQRRQRAYALLARNGFDPEMCRTVAATVAAEPESGRARLTGPVSGPGGERDFRG